MSSPLCCRQYLFEPIHSWQRVCSYLPLLTPPLLFSVIVLDLLINFSTPSTLSPQELSCCPRKAFCLWLSWAKKDLLLPQHTFLHSCFSLDLSSPVLQVLIFCFQTFLTANRRGGFLCRTERGADPLSCPPKGISVLHRQGTGRHYRTCLLRQSQCQEPSHPPKKIAMFSNNFGTSNHHVLRVSDQRYQMQN